MGYGQVVFFGVFEGEVFEFGWISCAICTFWGVCIDCIVGQVTLMVKVNDNAREQSYIAKEGKQEHPSHTIPINSMS